MSGRPNPFSTIMTIGMGIVMGFVMLNFCCCGGCGMLAALGRR